MKKLRLVSLSLAVAALLPSVTSCSSDPSPFNWTISSENIQKATIQLNLNVEETRADGMSTAEENDIKNFSVYVFDENSELETKVDFDVLDGKKTVTLEVSHGLKTLYVVTAKTNVNPSVGTSLTDYEKSVFNSSLSNIKPEKTVSSEEEGDTKVFQYVMIGKSKEQNVMMSASQEDLPASNIFNISLVRLVAKAQVSSVDADGSGFGISMISASFKAFQLNERMRVLPDGTDVFDSDVSTYADSNRNGTCDNYTLGVGNYLDAVSEFKAEGCAYLSENIVSNPLSGNTTFLAIRFATAPLKYYTFDESENSVKESEVNNASSTPVTYYAVGVQDTANGIVDYALFPGTNKIVTFKTLEDANNYKNSLNNGVSSAITVSQVDKPLQAASVTRATNDAPNFEVITFNNGFVYYRVNIAHEDSSGDSVKKKIRVMRNKFYKVNINSVNSLGFGSESLLRPSKYNAVLDVEGRPWISVSFSVAPWEAVSQEVDL